MRRAIKNSPATKKWNVGLKVSPEEEKKIKIRAIKKGMKVSDYIKQLVMDDLSANKVSIQVKSQ